jgi:hypothetical protein
VTRTRNQSVPEPEFKGRIRFANQVLLHKLKKSDIVNPMYPESMKIDADELLNYINSLIETVNILRVELSHVNIYLDSVDDFMKRLNRADKVRMDVPPLPK